MTDRAHLERLAAFTSALTWDRLPEPTRQAARAQLLDTVTAAIAALRSSETASILPALEAFAGPAGRATVIGRAERRAPHDAALANAALSMAQDFDDVVWMGHTGHSAVFASLAVAEHEGRDAREALVAMVAGNEVGGRLGASCVLGPLNGQMWTFVHLVAAAAATARLLRLDAERTSHALAIALAQPCFPLQPGFLRPSSKLLAAGTPTAIGIQAAYFARAGMTGEPAILEHPKGFWARFSYYPLPAMLGGLGETWTTQSFALKTHPGCHYFQTSCEALDRILARTGPLEAGSVRSVRIEVTKLAIEATRFAGELAAEHGAFTPVNVSFDLRITAAVLLVAGRLGSEEVEPERLAELSDRIRAIVPRIEVRHDPALTLKTIAAVAAMPAGRAALRGIGPRDVLRLSRRYRQEYRSELFAPGELAGWARAIARVLGRGRRPGDRDGRPASGAAAMPFPGRVTLELADGRVEREQVDLPSGSFCSTTWAQALERKVLTETAPSLGADGARTLLERGLALGEVDLARLTDAFRARTSPPGAQ